jgi:hypothetical protein
VDDLFPIFNDSDGWWYDPAGRHLDRERTRSWLTRAAAGFDTNGLSHRTARRHTTTGR